MTTLGTGVKSSPLENAVDHDALFYSYPDLARTEFNRYADGNGGSYQPRVNYSDGRSGDVLNVKDAASPTGGKSTLLHELQHAIQQREGFARGGSPSTAHLDPEVLATKDLNDWLSIEPYYKEANGDVDLAKQLYDKSNPGAINSFRFQYLADNYPNKIAKDLTSLEQLADKNIPTDPNQFYQRLAGEIEARDTAKRMNLTPEQRRATPPDLRDNAIVRFDQNGPNEAAGLMGYNAPPRFSVDPKRVAAEALQDAYSPIDTAIAVLTGGGGLASRAIQAAVDPFMEYVPKVADAINPRNIITGLMR